MAARGRRYVNEEYNKSYNLCFFFFAGLLFTVSHSTSSTKLKSAAVTDFHYEVFVEVQCRTVTLYDLFHVFNFHECDVVGNNLTLTFC